ncbi:MAG: HAD family hydrolase [Ruminococcaceae bacterium]|nr:HAD family hydrolase [Oscillospiraceae bacterium]
MQYNTILFDLDGTLTNPALGITNSIIYTLNHYGITPPAREELYKFIGPPLADSFKMFYNFPDDKAREAVDVYREYFGVNGLFENEVYDGIGEMLDKLNAAGYKLGVATSKPDVFSQQILEHFGLMDKFVFLSGNTIEETRPTKIQVIEYALENMNADPASTIMVGDRKFDILGAKHFGICPVGVLYGFGDREELETAGAEYICETVADLEKLLLGLN